MRLFKCLFVSVLFSFIVPHVTYAQTPTGAPRAAVVPPATTSPNNGLQQAGTFAFGYSVVPQDGQDAIGWFIAGSGRVYRNATAIMSLHVVAQLTGEYDDRRTEQVVENRRYAFVNGLRLCVGNRRVAFFGNGLVGVVSARHSVEESRFINEFTWELGGGMDLLLTGRTYARFQVDYRLGDTDKDRRVAIMSGLTIGF